MKKNEWFASWFDTPFYHILYQDRDFDEAEKFIDCLLAKLDPPKESSILDLACGKGRHAYFIAKKGFVVEGVDLSPESIRSAQQHFRLENLSFAVHDMRKNYKKDHFDYVFNFFTSFGYFDTLEDNIKVIEAMSHNLKSGGTVVIDFLNAHKAVQNLVKHEVKNVHSIAFDLKRKLENKFIVKDIAFSYQDQDYSYQEKVQALMLHDFQSFIEDTSLSLEKTYGSYTLDAFNKEESDRLIMVFKKA